MTIKILIVDDQVFDVALTMRAMDECDIAHQYVSVGDGEEAFHMLVNGDFDLILLDLKMPKVDGLELLQRLREDAAQMTPVIVVSSSNLDADVRAALALGAIEYVRKELEYSHFKQSLQTALGRHGFC